MNNPNSLLLAGTLNNTRSLTKFYLKHADGLDLQKQFNAGELKTNSIHWLVAHLTWAEDFLILRGIGNKGMNVPWFKKFKVGSAYPEKADLPDYNELVQTFEEAHKLALQTINELADEDLEQTNHIGLKFEAGDSKEIVIQHSIRHEGMHCGQLAWLLRMHGVEKII
ncbi:MAG: DinB family protein [Bacteroidia bacterium]